MCRIVIFSILLLCSAVCLTKGQDFRGDGGGFDDVYRPQLTRTETKRSEEVALQQGAVYQQGFGPTDYFETFGIGLDSSDRIYDQDWSVWTEWSFCSRSCGGGVAMRTRRCGIRTINDIATDCSGDDIQHKICNMQNCAENNDFRATQCAQYNNRKVYKTGLLKWRPYPGYDTAPCVLHCMPEGFEFYKSFGPVMDGTRCWGDKYDVCIEGKCVKVGCDQILGSNLTEDLCGVCGGDNSTCREYKGTLTQLNDEREGVTYSYVTTIPPAATHIRVTDSTNNYLALTDSSNRFVINGDLVIGWPGDFPVAGTTVKYARASNDVKESFTAKGPTTEEITIQLLNLGASPRIEYSYWLPISGTFDLSDRSRKHNLAELNAVTLVDEADYEAMFVGPYTPPATTVSTTTTTTPATTTTLATTTTKKARKARKSKRKKPAYCTPCKRPVNRNVHFCQSDFVIHARVLSKKKVEGKRFSHDVLIKTIYKSGFKLMKREYIWVYSSCCPKLRPFRDYLIMGRKRRVERPTGGKGVVQFVGNGTLAMDSDIGFETRLVVDHMDYWHTWKKKYERGMRKVANSNICKRFGKSPRNHVGRDPESSRSRKVKRIMRRRTARS